MITHKTLPMLILIAGLSLSGYTQENVAIDNTTHDMTKNESTHVTTATAEHNLTEEEKWNYITESLTKHALSSNQSFAQKIGTLLKNHTWLIIPIATMVIAMGILRGFDCVLGKLPTDSDINALLISIPSYFLAKTLCKSLPKKLLGASQKQDTLTPVIFEWEANSEKLPAELKSVLENVIKTLANNDVHQEQSYVAQDITLTTTSLNVGEENNLQDTN